MQNAANCQSAEAQARESQDQASQGQPPQEFKDEFIYELVKFGGKSQAWVACDLGISQGTVSRAIQRVERRQAQANPREEGRLDPQERLRVQRWLTYERNERLLASCLRIAGDVEGFMDISRTTISRNGLVGEENKVQTVHATLDRSGTAARFLRLAFRINMEQLKLMELEAEESASCSIADEAEPRGSAFPGRALSITHTYEAVGG